MTTESVLEHHLEAFVECDVDEILVDYDDGSVIITNDGTYRGLDEIRTLFEGLAADFGQAGSDVELDQQVIEDETAYIVWHGETPDNVYEFCTDTFVVHDDVITVQTFAGKIEPK